MSCLPPSTSKSRFQRRTQGSQGTPERTEAASLQGGASRNRAASGGWGQGREAGLSKLLSQHRREGQGDMAVMGPGHVFLFALKLALEYIKTPLRD